MGKVVAVVAPHADDDVLGLGASICQHVDHGDEVHVIRCMAGTEPEFPHALQTQINQEFAACGELLGVSSQQSFGFPIAKTFSVADLNGRLGRALANVNPALVYIPHWGDLHIDHRLVFAGNPLGCRGSRTRSASAFSKGVGCGSMRG